LKCGVNSGLKCGRKQSLPNLRFCLDIGMQEESIRSFIQVTVSPTRAVIGLLTRHNALRRHIHVMGLSNGPACRKCGSEEET